MNALWSSLKETLHLSCIYFFSTMFVTNIEKNILPCYLSPEGRPLMEIYHTYLHSLHCLKDLCKTGQISIATKIQIVSFYWKCCSWTMHTSIRYLHGNLWCWHFSRDFFYIYRYMKSNRVVFNSINHDAHQRWQDSCNKKLEHSMRIVYQSCSRVLLKGCKDPSKSGKVGMGTSLSSPPPQQ